MATTYNAPYKLLQRQLPFNIRYVQPGSEYVEGRGGRFQRAIPKVRGKAAVKRVKRARVHV